MTEEEAKTKWCPFGRVLVPLQTRLGNIHAFTAANRPNEPDATFKGGDCIGSGCMAWRWMDDVTSHGFCGLAGKPLV